jgi:predicted component of type VI protein secretion system
MEQNQSLRLSLSSHEEISRQLERMLASPDFKATPTQVVFLRYVVNQTLAGNGSRIKCLGTISLQSLLNKTGFIRSSMLDVRCSTFISFLFER